MKPIVLVFAGRIASGKSTIAQHIAVALRLAVGELRRVASGVTAKTLASFITGITSPAGIAQGADGCFYSTLYQTHERSHTTAVSVLDGLREHRRLPLATFGVQYAGAFPFVSLPRHDRAPIALWLLAAPAAQSTGPYAG